MAQKTTEGRNCFAGGVFKEGVGVGSSVEEVGELLLALGTRFFFEVFNKVIRIWLGGRGSEEEND